MWRWATGGASPTGCSSNRTGARALRPTASGVALLAYGPTDMPSAMALAATVTQCPALLHRPVREMLANPQICLVVDTAPGPSPLLAALLPMTDLLLTVPQVDATSVSLIPALESGVIYGAANNDRNSAAHVPIRASS